jgi:hypothetical protein
MSLIPVLEQQPDSRHAINESLICPCRTPPDREILTPMVNIWKKNGNRQELV